MVEILVAWEYEIVACAHIAASSGRKQMCEHKAQSE
jgi:hypothetical protein